MQLLPSAYTPVDPMLVSVVHMCSVPTLYILQLLPVGNHMKYPNDYLGWNGVLNTAIIIAIVVYAAVGFYGYMKFGNDIQASVSYNLPSDDWSVCFNND